MASEDAQVGDGERDHAQSGGRLRAELALRVSHPLVGDLAAKGISVRLTELRAPAQPLVLLPHRLGEVTPPAFGAERLRPGEADLTRSEGRPEVLGQRIVVDGRCSTPVEARAGWLAGGGAAGQRGGPLSASG